MSSKIALNNMNVKLDYLARHHFKLPQNYPSICKVTEFTVKVLTSDVVSLLDVVVFDIVLELQITYLGIDNLLHTLREELPFLRQIEKPCLNSRDFQCTDLHILNDFKLKFPEKHFTLRLRQFEAIIFLRLLCHLDFLPDQTTVGHTILQQKFLKNTEKKSFQKNMGRMKNYPWKKSLDTDSPLLKNNRTHL